ncbi:hypothetical protein PFBG_04067 [Plasmodium falciparum 7G8]|uniref:Uncharacterized protein n=1 Tax=Plasmodium falciparum (isolate 7G8) TaxID=57266 RepID=W7FBL0_PLAF8|nr:hypothetical protein PFBG_04067 [Plasmodium falciparum 7G8]
MAFSGFFKTKFPVDVHLYTIEGYNCKPYLFDCKLSVKKDKIIIWNNITELTFCEDKICDFLYIQLNMCYIRYINNDAIEKYIIVFMDISNTYYFYKYMMYCYIKGNLISYKYIDIYKVDCINRTLYKKKLFCIILQNHTKYEHIFVILKDDAEKKLKKYINISLLPKLNDQMNNSNGKGCEVHNADSIIRILKELYIKNEVFLIHIMNCINIQYSELECIYVDSTKFVLKNVFQIVEYNSFYSDGFSYRTFFLRDSDDDVWSNDEYTYYDKMKEIPVDTKPNIHNIQGIYYIIHRALERVKTIYCRIPTGYEILRNFYHGIHNDIQSSQQNNQYVQKNNIVHQERSSSDHANRNFGQHNMHNSQETHNDFQNILDAYQENIHLLRANLEDDHEICNIDEEMQKWEQTNERDQPTQEMNHEINNIEKKIVLINEQMCVIELPTYGVELSVYTIELPVHTIHLPIDSIDMSINGIKIPIHEIEIPLHKSEMSICKIEIPFCKTEIPIWKFEIPIRKHEQRIYDIDQHNGVIDHIIREIDDEIINFNKSISDINKNHIKCDQVHSHMNQSHHNITPSNCNTDQLNFDSDKSKMGDVQPNDQFNRFHMNNGQSNDKFDKLEIKSSNNNIVPYKNLNHKETFNNIMNILYNNIYFTNENTNLCLDYVPLILQAIKLFNERKMENRKTLPQNEHNEHNEGVHVTALSQENNRSEEDGLEKEKDDICAKTNDHVETNDHIKGNDNVEKNYPFEKCRYSVNNNTQGEAQKNLFGFPNLMKNSVSAENKKQDVDVLERYIDDYTETTIKVLRENKKRRKRRSKNSTKYEMNVEEMLKYLTCEIYLNVKNFMKEVAKQYRNDDELYCVISNNVLSKYATVCDFVKKKVNKSRVSMHPINKKKKTNKIQRKNTIKKNKMIQKNKYNIKNLNKDDDNNNNNERGNRNATHNKSRNIKKNLHKYNSENTSYNTSENNNTFSNMYSNCVGNKFYMKFEGGKKYKSRMTNNPAWINEIINLSDSEESDNSEKKDDKKKKKEKQKYRMKYKHLSTSGIYSVVLRQNILPKGYKEKMERNSKELKLWNYINYDKIYNELCIFDFYDFNNRKKLYNVKREAFIYEDEKCIPKEIHINNEEGNQLILLDERYDTNFYMMDVKKEKLVRKWCNENIPITKLLKKMDNIYLGYNESSLFFVDTRLQRCIQNIFQYNKYASPIEHASIDNNGRITSSTSRGELKYYDGTINKQNKIKKSKNVIYCSDDMVHLTTSHKGLYSIVTCQKRIIIYDNFMDNKNFFDHVIRKCYRYQQNSIVLKLEPIDEFIHDLGDYTFIKTVSYSNSKYLFTFAKDFCVIWNLFQGINKNVSYTINKVPEDISDISLYDTSDEHDALLLATEYTLTLTRII